MENKILPLKSPEWYYSPLKSPEWYYYPRTLRDGTDFSKWECKYHMFTMTVTKTASNKESQPPYFAEIRIPGGTVILKTLPYGMRMEADHKTLLISGGPSGFSTKNEAKKYCIDLVNAYLSIMRSIPPIEDESLRYEHFLVPMAEDSKGEE